MFFKAGAYSQNNSSPEPETDFDKVSIFKLSHSYSSVPEGEMVVEQSADAVAVANNFGMLAFHVNSKNFGSSKAADSPDNGIEFSNVTLVGSGVSCGEWCATMTSRAFGIHY